MRRSENEFRKQYKEWRERVGLTYRALEARTGIKHSALVAMQSGNRPCGEQSARRIAEAFGLSGEAREAFVLAALNTSKERVLESVKTFPAVVLNMVGLLLLAHGVKPKQIVGCDMGAPSPTGGGNLCLSLAGGRRLSLEIRLVPIS